MPNIYGYSDVGGREGRKKGVWWCRWVGEKEGGREGSVGQEGRTGVGVWRDGMCCI